MHLLPRTALHAQVLRALGSSPVAASLGPRQAGRTTLARQILSER